MTKDEIDFKNDCLTIVCDLAFSIKSILKCQDAPLKLLKWTLSIENNLDSKVKDGARMLKACKTTLKYKFKDFGAITIKIKVVPSTKGSKALIFFQGSKDRFNIDEARLIIADKIRKRFILFNVLN
jgi:hypothetical protein